MILGRRTATPAEAAEPEPAETPSPAGKGRPTPKRAEARQARRKAAPANRREAAGQQRDRNREARMRARQALITGDERYLPPRDAGPERRLARDVVDSRFTVGQYFMIVIFVAFVGGGVIANRTVNIVSNYVGLLALTVIVLDSARAGRAAKRAVAAKHGASEVRGISSYAFMRAMLPRRFRRPPPKVTRGGNPI
ncbi:MAG TPA: DUF3043 domain-containing protein [Mycobacteriales bacterium]|nr:DUF3043 domain-containing protein [Mycobacteriales bacterium]HVX69376.1 DUF3043 domain-containing protein [Mycobacteriales bacterium]